VGGQSSLHARPIRGNGTGSFVEEGDQLDTAVRALEEGDAIMQNETTTNGAKKAPGAEPKTPAADTAVTGSTKGGRPKVREQTMPIIVASARSRVTENVVMSATAARDLRRYVEWASSKIGIPEDEAMILTLDRALGDLLKKDKLWLDYKEKFLDDGRGKEEG
jgi:hypothetical protein